MKTALRAGDPVLLLETKALFAEEGLTVQVFHIGSYLRARVGCDETHNPYAYTFLAVREA